MPIKRGYFIHTIIACIFSFFFVTTSFAEEISAKTEQLVNKEISKVTNHDTEKSKLPQEIYFGENASEPGIIEGLMLKDNEEEKVATFEKISPVDPVLIVDGKPGEEKKEKEETFHYEGRIVLEPQNITKRKKVFRWVLKMSNGLRLPLKSNLLLLQKVKDEELLDGFVKISGKIKTSGMNKQLRFLQPTGIRSIEQLTEEKSPDNKIATATIIASETEKMNSKKENKLSIDTAKTSSDKPEKKSDDI